MDWAAPVDLYCERVGLGLASEPLNALSNAAFFCAAAYGMVAARRAGSAFAVWSLCWLVAAIGVGSLAFHTIAQRWSELADIIPITVFIYVYFGFALRRFAGLSWLATVLLLLALAAVNIAIGSFAPPGMINGSLDYLPALLAAIGFALLLRTMSHPAHPYLGAAAAVLAVSLFFRTIDRAICPVLPMGTHFLWHTLNGLLLAIYLKAAVRYGAGPLEKN